MRTMSLTLTLGLVFAAGLHAADKKDDASRIQGTWHILRGEDKGKPVAVDKTRGTVVFTRDSIRITEGEKKMTWVMSYKLDPAQKPKTITMTVEEGTDKGKTAEGIYEWQGDNLKLCYSLPGKPRPTKFDSDEKNGTMLFVLARGASR